MERPERIARINEQLRDRGLKELRFLGDIRRGEPEITSIIGFDECSRNRYTLVWYGLLMPDGKEDRVCVRYDANGQLAETSIVIVRTDDKYLIQEKWYSAQSSWTYSFLWQSSTPDRCLRAEWSGSARGAPDLVMLGDIAAEAYDLATKRSMHYLGNPILEPAFSAGNPTVALLDLKIPKDHLPGLLQKTRPFTRYALWSNNQLHDEIGKRINDIPSLAAYALLTKSKL